MSRPVSSPNLSPNNKSLAGLNSADSPVHGYDGDLMLDYARDRIEREGSDPRGNSVTGDAGLGHRGSRRQNKDEGESLGRPGARSPRASQARVTRSRSWKGREGNNSPTNTERASTSGTTVGAVISKSAQQAQIEKHALDARHVERDVEGNFLAKSHFYGGFNYMMAKAAETNSLAANLREELFPQLALALEAVLHDAVKEQLEKELRLKKQQQQILGQHSHSMASMSHTQSSSGLHHAASSANFGPVPSMASAAGGEAKGKSWRQHPTYPSQPLRASTTAVHPVIMLAKELKKRSKTYQRENPPKVTPPPEESELTSPATELSSAKPGFSTSATMEGSVASINLPSDLGETVAGLSVTATPLKTNSVDPNNSSFGRSTAPAPTMNVLRPAPLQPAAIRQ